MLTVNAAYSNTAESVRECDFYDLACETDDYSRKLYETAVTEALRGIAAIDFSRYGSLYFSGADSRMCTG